MPRLSGTTKERRREMLDARVDAGKALNSEKGVCGEMPGSACRKFWTLAVVRELPASFQGIKHPLLTFSD